MKIEVYDTYLRHADGKIMHFDVLLAEGSDSHEAVQIAVRWLHSIGVKADMKGLQSCRYCHTEEGMPEVESVIANEGFAILQMEGCPASVK